MPNNRIPKEKRALILAALVEGAAINSICRMFRVGKPNVLRFLCEAGKACEDWHNRHFRNLQIERIEADEQWAYVHTHRERLSPEEKDASPWKADAWLWIAIDPKSKAVVSWLTGKRTVQSARAFCHELATRVPGRVQVTSDPLIAYHSSLIAAFGDRLDYATEAKLFKSSFVPAHEWPKYRVDPLVGVDRKPICGSPDLGTSTVCHAERYFLTVRQSNKRCARKTLAYSKRWDNHATIASLQTFVYNLVRKHETTGTTPAVALGIVETRWSLEDVVMMTDEYLRAQQDAEFEIAITSQTSPRVTSRPRMFPKKAQGTAWYLDPESGGPSPLVRKLGIAYAETQPRARYKF